MEPLNNISGVIEVPETRRESPKSFIEANTTAYTLEDLKSKCIVPMFSTGEKVISHAAFIEAAVEAVSSFYPGEATSEPAVRVSHPIMGCVASAIHKPFQYLEEHERTIYWDRMAFTIPITSISDEVGGNLLNLTLGGVKSYNQDNLHSRKTADERFKLFIGFQNTVCLNLCVWSDGLINDIRVNSLGQLRAGLRSLIENYNAVYHLTTMKKLVDYSLTEKQFATFIGKCRMYPNLSMNQKSEIPPLLLGDTQVGQVCKEYYKDPNFRKSKEGSLSLWKLYNLLTAAGKSSYIDNFLDKSVNAFQIVEGLKNALDGKATSWFLS